MSLHLHLKSEQQRTIKTDLIPFLFSSLKIENKIKQESGAAAAAAIYNDNGMKNTENKNAKKR